MGHRSEMERDEAVDAVASAIRRLFSFVSDDQARQVAGAVLSELESSRIRLVRESGRELLCRE